MKYPYPRADLTIRVSDELLQLVHDMSQDLDVSVQDVGVFSLLMILDSSGVGCPDWSTIAETLTTDETVISIACSGDGAEI